MTVVVVGASVGGVATVTALRQGGYDGEITLVDADETALYDRPPLSKEVLVDGVELEQIRLVQPDALEGLDLELRLGERAVQLDLDARHLALAGGATLSFDQLVIATGSTPRVLPGMRERPGLHLLRTYEDALRLRGDLLEGGNLTVIGGGVIGLEVASSARQLGVEVTVIEPLESPMERVVGPALGPYLRSLLARSGVTFLAGTAVTSLLGDRTCEGVQVDSGAQLLSECTLVSIGTSPATEWLMGTPLMIEDGLVCDASCRAVGADGVFAVGDVCRWFNPRYGRLMRSENWTSAQEQAAVVASAILGSPRDLDQVPYVWSDQFGHRIQILGVPNGHEAVRLFVDGSTDDPTALYADHSGRIAAVIAVDQPRLVAQARRALIRGTGIEELVSQIESGHREVDPDLWTVSTRP